MTLVSLYEREYVCSGASNLLLSCQIGLIEKTPLSLLNAQRAIICTIFEYHTRANNGRS